MKRKTLDANEATAYIAYKLNEICSIYPITPSSPMAELADAWAVKGEKNIWGNIPTVVEMQSEGGAVGAVHGSLQAGALTTTFTASQGLLLMIPNMFKIAGELSPTVFHVAARTIATQALSIFGEHSDVMATRTTGFAQLCSASVQEAHDMSLVAQAATLASQVPFLHFFDGFRTSHEISKIEMLEDDVLRAMIDDRWVQDFRNRALNPQKPVIRGTAQNPDVFFQSRETVNPKYIELPGILEGLLEKFKSLTGRAYKLFEYSGHPEAEHLVVIMGSGGETVEETVKHLNKQGEKTGVLQVRLFRPFSTKHLLEAIPKSVKRIAVLDRTKEPGSTGEPLFQDVSLAYVEAVKENNAQTIPEIYGGRYGLGSKEFTPAMAKGVFDAIRNNTLKDSFTVGIVDDVTHSHVDYDASFSLDDENMTQAMFFGLGADGTVGANKNTIKIIGENTDMHAQGYFVYDSKKSGAKTVSHLRFGKDPIRAPYLIDKADFIACHKFNFINEVDMLKYAKDGATFLVNSRYGKDDVWDNLPKKVQETILEKDIELYVIDASTVARDVGMGSRINTIMQTCFFALSGVLPKDEAIGKIKESIEKSYIKKGQDVVDLNFKAVESALEHLHKVEYPEKITGKVSEKTDVFKNAPDFVKNVTAKMMEGQGDALPVSAFPNDGTYPLGTAKYEKRNIADFVPVWEEDLCIQCGNCAYVCPHSVIRAKYYHKDTLNDAPIKFKHAPINAKGFPETKYTLQVYLEDCTGCQLCVEACPVSSEENNGIKAINMHAKHDIADEELENIEFFDTIPFNDRSKVDFSLVRGTQFLQPMFEFSGACAGCGETPYIKLVSQLFGDRAVIANATGCSSIFGANLPTTPWTTNDKGHGPAWANSLFEDNAEFGLGMRVSIDHQSKMAGELLEEMADQIPGNLAADILNAEQKIESQIQDQINRVYDLKEHLKTVESPTAKNLLAIADNLIKRSVWLIGGDGWAYDIGSAGLDHAMASGKDINVMVLDTEVYSNTGGQMSKATPTAATAKFAAAGKQVGKKDLAMQAISYGNVYVAQISMGANPQQTLLAIREAEAFPGPSLILAYSPCIAHGIKMEKSLEQMNLAVKSGYWPLIRYNPVLRKKNENPFILDSPRPTTTLKDYAYRELRYKVLANFDPEEAERLMKIAQEIVDLRWKNYEAMARSEAEAFTPFA